MSDLLKAALDYAGHGIRVFPIKPRGKTPLTPHGHNDGTTDPAQIKAWWDTWPDANIGVVCGNDLAVLDIDGPIGAQSYADLVARHGPIPPTLTAKTPNGYHLWLKDDADDPLPIGASQLGKKLDTRAGGRGYVVAPPSVRDDGEYVWFRSGPRAPVPPWLREALRRKSRRSDPLEAETFEDGERNLLLIRVAGKLRHQGFSQEEIEQTLLATNMQRCVPPLEEDEVKLVAWSAARYEPSPVHDQFRPGPEGVFEPDEGFRVDEVPTDGVLELVESLRAVSTSGFLARLDQVYEAIGEVEDSKQRAFASALANRYLRERLGGAQTVAMFQMQGKHAGPAIITMNQLLEDPDMLAPPEVVVPHLAYRGRLTMIAGRDKSGKSTLAAHAVAAITQGDRFLGDPITQGKVILATPDESPRDTLQRLAALDAVPDNVLMFDYYQPTLLEDVQREIDRVDGVRLVVFDSLQAVARTVLGAAPGTADAAGWSEVVRPMADLAHNNDIAVLLLHHVRKSDGEARDSSEILAAVDGTFTLREPGDGFDPRVRFLNARTRWPAEDFAVQLIEGEGYQLTAGARKLSLEARVLLFLQDNPGASQRKIRMGVPGRNEDIGRVLEWLLEEGHITDHGDEVASSYFVSTNDPVAAFEADAVVHKDREEDDGIDHGHRPEQAPERDAGGTPHG